MMSIGSAKDHNIIVNEGCLYVGNFSNVSATSDFVKGLESSTLGVFKDKLTITAKAKIREIKNAAQKVKNWQYIDQWNIKITGDLLDFNDKLLETSLFKKAEDGHYVATTGLIDSTKYKDALVVGENNKGEIVIVLVRDVFNTEGLDFEMIGNDEAGFKISLENAYDKDVVPVEVFGNKEMAQATTATSQV